MLRTKRFLGLGLVARQVAPSFEDGKLTPEAFDGELHRSAYGQLVAQGAAAFLEIFPLLLTFRD